MREKTIGEFNEALASVSPVPGGGSVSALVGALGAGLGVMVGCITKKHGDSEALKAVTEEAANIQKRLLELIDEDAEGFEPLSRAYSMPKDAPDRAEITEKCLVKAAEAPMEIAKLSCRAIELMGKLSELSDALTISDVGCGAVLCKAALLSASLNVYANTRLMKDRETAKKLNAEVKEMVKKYAPSADGTYEKDEKSLLQNAKM